MLLPQSSAFGALKNRLNSVSSIGYLHIVPRPYVSSAISLTHSRQGSVGDAAPSSSQDRKAGSKSVHDTHVSSSSSSVTTPGTSSSNYDRPNRLGVKGREENIIRWDQLLEKFKSVQDKARRAQRLMNGGTLDDFPDLNGLQLTDGAGEGLDKPQRPPGPPVPQKDTAPPPAAAPKRSSGIGRQFGRLGGAVSGRTRKSQG